VKERVSAGKEQNANKTFSFIFRSSLPSIHIFPTHQQMSWSSDEEELEEVKVESEESESVSLSHNRNPPPLHHPDLSSDLPYSIPSLSHIKNKQKNTFFLSFFVSFLFSLFLLSSLYFAHFADIVVMTSYSFECRCNMRREY